MERIPVKLAACIGFLGCFLISTNLEAQTVPSVAEGAADRGACARPCVRLDRKQGNRRELAWEFVGPRGPNPNVADRHSATRLRNRRVFGSRMSRRCAT